MRRIEIPPLRQVCVHCKWIDCKCNTVKCVSEISFGLELNEELLKEKNANKNGSKIRRKNVSKGTADMNDTTSEKPEYVMIHSKEKSDLSKEYRDASKFDERMFMKWLKQQINLDDEKNIKIHSCRDNFRLNDYEQIEILRKGSEELIEMEVDETEDLSPMSSVREKGKKQPFNVNIMNLLKDLDGGTSEQNEKMLNQC